MTNTTRAWIWGAGMGASAMLLLDPARGRRRRALLRDKLAAARHTTAHALAVTRRDLSHRMSGTVAGLRATTRQRQTDDEVLVARVRSALGRHVSHPSAVRVTAHEGRVVLEGPVLAYEVNDLLDAVRSVPGVREVENRLEVHKAPDSVPSLQGGSGWRRPRAAFMRDNWSPTTRLVAGMGGATLLAWGLTRRAPIAAASVAAGTGLMARSLTNVELRRLMGMTGRRGIDVQKTITIHAPVEDVFALWRHYENFPRFMRHVRDVRDLGGGRSRWTVDGPGGVPIQWDAEITRFIPNELIAWKSLPDSAIAHAGFVRFEPAGDGATRVTIRLTYNPIAGAAGHSVAWLFGADPKHQLDDDLVRMKTLIEEGVAPHDAARPDRRDRTEAAARTERPGGQTDTAPTETAAAVAAASPSEPRPESAAPAAAPKTMGGHA